MNDRLFFLKKDGKNNEYYIQRDDLLHFSFGGNKVIIAGAQLNDMKEKGFDIMIGYGNSRSNLCRVLSNLCYSKQIPCKIISPLDDDDTFTPSYNNSFIAATGTEIISCKKSEAGSVIAKVKKDCEDLGLKPYFVYDIDNIKAPVQAYSEVFSTVTPFADYIFLATGTGTTTAGILTGMIKNALSEGKISQHLVGISVARTAERELPVISSYLKTQGEEIHKYYEDNKEKLFTFEDKYVGKGYGSIEKNVEETIRNTLLCHGVPLDPTYTGKAFYGMEEYVRQHNIEGKRILFWHTGGLPLFFDYFKQ